MKTEEVRKRFLAFFKERGHAIIPSASLMPENDPTTLFTGSGMQPLIPYLLGKRHPLGVRLANSQKCFRSQDIEEVGDNRHTTFFEMLGNWSLGDYWKQEQLSWFFEFLTKEVGVSKDKLWITCFEGDEKLGLPRDDESAGIWKKLGIPKERIKFYDSKKNWWSRSGIPLNMPAGEPGGPDSEVFYEFTQVPHNLKCGAECHPNCDCGRFMEIGNSVFMEYVKQADGTFKPLPRKNVDFGGGLERITAAANNDPDIFNLDVFVPTINQLEKSSGKSYKENPTPFRIIADHTRAASFLTKDGIFPSNVGQGYVIRRLLRRAILYCDRLGAQLPGEFQKEEEKFREKLEPGLRNLEKLAYPMLQRFSDGQSIQRIHQATDVKGGEMLFNVFSTYGFPLELSLEEISKLREKRGFSALSAEQKEQIANGFQKALNEHQEISRAGIEKKFKGGLADHSEKSLQYHTATHLLHQALRDVLGTSVYQNGSNITPLRLRFDFSFERKMTDEEKRRVEDIVNQRIKEDLPVSHEDIPLEEAKRKGAIGLFEEKYGDKVRVYKVGNYSLEFCGGPHVTRTGELKGPFKILKDEAVSAGVRRIKAILE